MVFGLACDDADPAGIALCMPALAQAARALLSLPFDALREQYAHAARAGMVERSIIASGHVERAIDALEQMSYGPFARRA